MITREEQSILTKKASSAQNAQYFKKSLLRKNTKTNFSALSAKQNPGKETRSVFAGIFELVETIKFEIEPKETVHCFLDGCGNYGSNLISF